MEELSTIFSELVRMLKDLPPGGFDKAYSTRTVSATGPRVPVSFMCDKQQFKDIVRLAEHGAWKAEEANLTESPPLDHLSETVLAGLKSLEVKVDQLALDTANLAARQPPAAKSFANAVQQGLQTSPQMSKSKPGVKAKKHTAPPPPPQIPKITLSQVAADKERFVEMSTDASRLASRATTALLVALQEHAIESNTDRSHFTLRGISRNAFTGDIHLHLSDMESVRAILGLKSDEWVNDINKGLSLKRKAYPIIVHGLPTTFDPQSKTHLHDFMEENHGVLDTATRMIWANKHSIESGKPFSSLIIHLTDPTAANNAIRNRICFKHVLKVTERSTKRVRQCYKCLDFGHFAAACPEETRSCSHCAGGHAYDDCPKMADPLCCVNCAQKYLEAAYPGESSIPTSRLTPEQRRKCTHSPFSNVCPLRRVQVAQMAHISDYFETGPDV